MVIPRTVEGVRSFTNEREREREIKGTVGERLGGATRGRYGGGTKDHRWRICTVDRISRAGHARNLAERNHVLPRFGARLGEDAEWRDYGGEVIVGGGCSEESSSGSANRILPNLQCLCYYIIGKY